MRSPRRVLRSLCHRLFRRASRHIESEDAFRRIDQVKIIFRTSPSVSLTIREQDNAPAELTTDIEYGRIEKA